MNYDSLKIIATTVVAKLLQEKYGTRITLAELIDHAVAALDVQLTPEEKNIIHAGITICNERR